MQYCKKCRVSIRGDKTCCPLCQGEVTGESSENAFPTIKQKGVSTFSLFKLFSFLFVACEIVCLCLHLLTHFSEVWITFAMLAAVVIWADIAIGIYLRHNILKTLTLQVYAAMVVCVIVDFLLGFSGWSVQWVLPSCFVGLVVITFALGLATWMSRVDYVWYIIFHILLSIVSGCLFILLGLNTFIWPAVVSMIGLLIIGVWVLIFWFSDLKKATIRLFHM